MSSRWLRVLPAACVAAILLLPAGAAAADSCRGENATITAANEAESDRVLLCLVNVHRAENSLPALTRDASLESAARGHSRYMQDTGEFDHEGIGDGTPGERATAAGYPYAVGENIARTNFPGYTTREMFEIWRRSPGHNANMLGDFYVTSGMGLITGPYGVVGTQMFGVEDNGGTDTAIDLLITGECRAAGEAVGPATAKVAKARKRLRQAEGDRRRTRAKRKLKRARKALKRAREAELAACGPVSY